MSNYMNSKNLQTLTDSDVYFAIKSYADKHDEYEDIIAFVKKDISSLLQILDDPKVFKSLMDQKESILPISTFFFFFIVIRNAFKKFGKDKSFVGKVNEYKGFRGRELWTSQHVNDCLSDLDLHIYLANILSFFSHSIKMNDPDKTQNGWVYVSEIIEKLQKADNKESFYLMAFVGNYTLCLTGLYQEYIKHKHEYGRRLVGVEFYSDFGENFFRSASHNTLADNMGLSEILFGLGDGYNVIRLALDELQRKKYFNTSSVA